MLPLQRRQAELLCCLGLSGFGQPCHRAAFVDNQRRKGYQRNGHCWNTPPIQEGRQYCI